MTVLVIAVIMIVEVTICRMYWGCDAPKQKQVIETDGGVEIYPGELFEGETVFQTSDAGISDTDGGAK